MFIAEGYNTFINEEKLKCVMSMSKYRMIKHQ